VDGYSNSSLATEEDLIEDFGSDRLAIGFPVTPTDYEPPAPEKNG
jgi:hypothetical protein